MFESFSRLHRFTAPDAPFSPLIIISFFHSFYFKNVNGLMKDEMGLGKSVQIAVYLAGLFKSGFIQHALVVVPASLSSHWKRELCRWCPGVTTALFIGNKQKRGRELGRILANGGICITTYGKYLGRTMTHFKPNLTIDAGLVKTSVEVLNAIEWDCVLLDVGSSQATAASLTRYL